ncbi:MAG: CapA family protein [Leptolyngbyaceae cyanobacterium bins.302]|nr:CapA family protein [Leptolyngbyaceae cyanobacterium bins.302]
MVQSSSLHYTSVFESARRGNSRAIATWLNQALMPHGVRARVGAKRPGSLKLLVEFDFPLDPANPPRVWQDQLIRLICHRLWKLNSPLIEGASIAARFLEHPQKLVWQRSVRIVTPASRLKRQHHSQLRSRIRQTSRRKNRLKTTRALLVGGPAVAAVMVGGIMGYTRAPVEQTDANASSQPKAPTSNLPTRPDTVRTALETVSVVKHNEVANPQDPTVTLMFSGDVTLAETFKEVMGNQYAQTFAQMPEYQQADVAMVNLENPLTRATLPMPGKQFNFKADPESIEVLKSGGVDIVTLANNHSMDYDAAGLKETIANLEAAGIEYMGAGNDVTHARRPQIVDVKGQRIAYLAYWGEEYGAEANKPGVNNIYEDRIAEDIRAIRDQVDWVVVNYHWGQELADFPADWQVKLAHFTVDQGADVVVGHHPHVLQGAEVYKGRPIAYSLGNFIFGGNSRTDYDTAVLRVALKDKQMKVEFLPVEVKGYQPKVIQGDRAKDVLNHLTQISTEFKQPMPTSVVLDARTPATPTPDTTTPPVTPLTPNPQPPTPSFDSLPTPLPESSPLPSPDALQPELPGAGTKGQETPAAPDALTTPTQPDGATEMAPPPDPENLNVLPGYGGTPVPVPAPAPTIDPLNPDAYLDTPPAPVNPTTNSITPGTAPPDATAPSGADPLASPSPQLPSFSQPSNSFTNSPNTTPLNFEQTPPQPNTQGSKPDDRSISFMIQADAEPEVDEAEPLQVALAGPMMW